MDEQHFVKALQEKNIFLSERQQEQFQMYYECLVESNKKLNLTAITDKNEVYLKHFYDCLTPLFYTSMDKELTLCDVGAGAGFPSLPMLIVHPEIKVTIIDSLQKRINFLRDLVNQLGLKNVELVHGRAEDVGRMKEYREQYDVVTARAVARMSVLSEYCLPLCKVDGLFIALKGGSATEEIADAKKAFQALGEGKVDYHTFQLPMEESERTIVHVHKTKKTPKKYPRKAGVPAKKPIS